MAVELKDAGIAEIVELSTLSVALLRPGVEFVEKLGTILAVVLMLGGNGVVEVIFEGFAVELTGLAVELTKFFVT